jgi:flagellar hook assembly protein FlgD
MAVVADQAGWVQTEWDGKASSGEAAASGIYFMKVRIGQDTQTVRGVLLK